MRNAKEKHHRYIKLLNNSKQTRNKTHRATRSGKKRKSRRKKIRLTPQKKKTECRYSSENSSLFAIRMSISPRSSVHRRAADRAAALQHFGDGEINGISSLKSTNAEPLLQSSTVAHSASTTVAVCSYNYKANESLTYYQYVSEY